MIPIGLNKQQALDADPKPYQRINFTANSHREENPRISFILREAKTSVLDFSQGTVKV